MGVLGVIVLASLPSVRLAQAGEPVRAARDAASGFAVAVPVPLVVQGSGTASDGTLRYRLASETGAPPVAGEGALCTLSFKAADPSGVLAHFDQIQLNQPETVDAGAERLKQKIVATGATVEAVLPIGFAYGGVNGVEIVYAPPAPDAAGVRHYLAAGYTPQGIISLACSTTPTAMVEARVLFRSVVWGARVEP